VRRGLSAAALACLAAVASASACDGDSLSAARPAEARDASNEAPSSDASAAPEAAAPEAGDDAGITIHVRRVAGEQVDLRAAPVAGSGNVSVLEHRRSLGEGLPAWSWHLVGPDGTALRAGAFVASDAGALGDVAPVVEGALGHRLLAVARPASPARTAATLLTFPPPGTSSTLALSASVVLPDALADAFEPGMVDDADYRARCASPDPVYVYGKRDPHEAVRALELAGGEHVVITSSCGFARARRLGADGGIVATSDLLSFGGVGGVPTGVGFVPVVTAAGAGPDGSVVVAVEIRPGWDWDGALASLGLPPSPATTTTAIVVFRVEPSGAVAWRRLLTFDAVRAVRRIVADGTTIFLVGQALRDTGVPGDARSSDIWLASLDASTGARLQERTLDIESEDWVDAAIRDPRGGVVVGARAGAVQVDTGSVVAFPDVVLLSFDGSLVERDRARFGSPRADSILHLASTPDGLLVSGTWDGPITHTPDAERDTAGFWTVLPLGRWSSLTFGTTSW